MTKRPPAPLLLKRRGRAANSVFASTLAEAPAGDDPPEAPLPAGTEAPHKPLDALPTIGQIGRYALKHRIGEGGLGSVYAALDPLLSRSVAVKMLHVEVEPSQRPVLDAHFLQEARAAARLNHPHIVTVHDAGADRRGLYIAMERLKGADLRHLLRDGWRPTPVQAAQIVRRVADALAYAHGKGVVHCDIKPANIFMVGRTVPKVLDFGIARITRGPHGTARGGLVAGSPAYMAPEQLRGEAVDRRSDVYSLGLVFYELLSGQRAFAAVSDADSIAAVQAQPPRPLQSLDPALPADLVALVNRAIMKEPAQRFDSARQLSQALSLWLRQQRDRATPSTRSALPWPAALTALLLLGTIAVAGSGWRPAGWSPAAAAAPPTTAPAVVPPPAAMPVATAASEPAVEAAAEATTPVEPAPATPMPPAPMPPAQAAPLRVAAAAATPPRPKRPAAVASPAATAPLASGVLQIAVSPWGEVEVDGAAAGTTPPLSQLSLSEGAHTVTIRNADFPPFSASVRISADHPVVLKHRFGS